MKFKTKKQKLLHHNKLEPECKGQKMCLLKLIAHYKRVLMAVSETKNIKTTEQFLKLKRHYENCEKNSSDPDYFFSVLGDSIDDTPK
jgi:hypothetical protein